MRLTVSDTFLDNRMLLWALPSVFVQCKVLLLL
jgi:hypothetical protein